MPRVSLRVALPIAQRFGVRGGQPERRFPSRKGAILNYGMHAGIVAVMAGTRKITVHVPDELLKKAQRDTGEGVTETVRQGLRLVAASRAYDDLRRRRGSVRLALNLDKLREDRR